jgi:hypothetical protein
LQQDNRNPPPDPHKLLFLLDPSYADLIVEENEFDKKVQQVAREHKFWFQKIPTWQ